MIFLFKKLFWLFVPIFIGLVIGYFFLKKKIFHKIKNRDTCAYCGMKCEATRDHVFSRGLFPKKYPRTKNVLTVPSCHRCNNGLSADEEHFRVLLVNIASEYSKEANDVLFSKIRSSIEKAPGKGHKIFASMELVNLFDAGGNFLGKRTKINISKEDWRRYHRVLDKYIKGLFFSQHGRVIPNNYLLKHALIKHKDFPEFAKQIAHWNEDEKQIIVYGYNFVPGSDASIWITIFYDQVAFLTLVMPKKQIENLER